MRLSWNEICARAKVFAEEFRDARRETSETQTFYNEFFEVFGVKRRRVAVYEESVEKIKGDRGFIDLFWPGTLIVEQKSKGRDLFKAKIQALDYTHRLSDADMPRFVLVSDFQTFELTDLDTRDVTAFALADLPKHVEKFGFILGRQTRRFKDQDPVNIKAAELVGHLHDRLEASGYAGHDLERFLVRIVFCLFADDTEIFEPKDILWDWLKNAPPDADIGARLGRLFEVLNTHEDQRHDTLDEALAQFPYVNGQLFDERIAMPSFDADMRAALENACRFDWTPISPAIFGSLFQSVMDPVERRAKGAHYTTEKNIMKVIEPLFLDDLRAEFDHLKSLKSGRRKRLLTFQNKLAALTFLDPACGCGNFLIISYRELRLMEIELLREAHGAGQLELDVQVLSKIDVDQFYGIEFEEFPARIAETALWMMDHIMNTRLSMEFGQVFLRIPLEKSPHILHADALEVDWADLLPPENCSFVLGNPPFVGHQNRDKAQVAGMHRVWGTSGQFNRLDFVTCWFKKSIEYFGKLPEAKIGLVATNSITQGEQCGILWPMIFGAGFSIAFAHRTFQWNSEVKKAAAVHCVIIGLSNARPRQCRIYDYADVKGEPAVSIVDRINGYLVNGPQWSVPARSKPQDGQLQIHKGSQPTDGARIKKQGGGYETRSNLILESYDADGLRELYPELDPFLRPYIGGRELINGNWRFCLWLKNAPPNILRGNSEVAARLKRVREGRLLSPTKSVRDFSIFPTLFTQDRQPDHAYVAIPEVSSETREYIPIGFLEPDVIASNKLMIMPGGTKSDFGLLISRMHMAWMSTVTGRLKNDYSYSPSVYFTFPLPPKMGSPSTFQFLGSEPPASSRSASAKF